ATKQRAIATFTKKGLGLFASMRGTLAVDNDPAVMDRLWSPMVEAWFEGRNDPRITLLRLDVTEAQVGLNEGQLLAGVKLMLGIKTTGQDGQDRDTVDLHWPGSPAPRLPVPRSRSSQTEAPHPQPAVRRVLPADSAPYQIRTRSSGAMYSGSASVTLNASYHASMLRSGAKARMWPGEWVPLTSCWRSASSRHRVRQTCAQPMNRRCSPVNPSITGASWPSSERR